MAYLIALPASLYGFDEVALHSFFFLVGALAAFGLYFLGRQFGISPLLTSALTVSTPAFLVYATNVMSDVTMVMFWIWALVFWMNARNA